MKKIRINNNLLQKNLAEILQISQHTYSHYETQDSIIPISHLTIFCDYFNISLDYIFGFNNKTYKFVKNNKNIYCSRLKEFRKENNLTQEKLANILNTNKSVICNYEKGRNLIATPFLYDICKKYNISADYLLGRIDNPKYLK